MATDATSHPRRSYPAGLTFAQWALPDGASLRTYALAPAGEPRGTLLFLGGRGDFIEKYLEALQVWAAAGWHVTGFDWRGQGGSGLSHPDGWCHASDFAPLVADLAQFCRNKLPPGRPLVGIGHSLGGHLLLRAVAEGAIELDGMVLAAPMLGIRAGRLGARSVNLLGRLGTLPPLRERPVWRGSRNTAPGHLTSCPERHADKLWWKAQRPELGRGGPTFGWLAAATRSIAGLEQRLRRDPPNVPALVLRAQRDTIVDGPAMARTCALLPGARLVEIAGAGHEVLRESDSPRLAALAAINLFLDGLSGKLSTVSPPLSSN